LGFYSEGERAKLVDELSGHTAPPWISLIDKLNGDPFLCGLALSSDLANRFSADADRAALMREIFEDVLRRAAFQYRRC
jgi:hypothetical protein